VKAYLAGPMRTKPLYNGKEFVRYARILRALGYEVLSPWEHQLEWGIDPSQPMDAQGFDLHAAFVWDFKAVMDCDVVFVLPDWEPSVGVAAELVVAAFTGKPVYEFLPGSESYRRLHYAPKISIKGLTDG
jgi:nucleoside 2-deoxyribosyltransferase